MDTAIRLAMAVIIAYLSGSIPWAYIVVHIFWRQDIRAFGSGNAGATNVLRVFGTAPGVAVLVLDVAKGALGVWLTSLLIPDGAGQPLADWFGVIGAAGAIAGHAFSPWIGFRGGKGVATAGGALLVLAPRVWPPMIVLFLVIVAIGRMVSLGSIVLAAVFPLVVAIVYPDRWVLFGFAVATGLLVLWRHRSNLARIARGEEAKITFKRRMWDTIKQHRQNKDA